MEFDKLLLEWYSITAIIMHVNECEHNINRLECVGG